MEILYNDKKIDDKIDALGEGEREALRGELMQFNFDDKDGFVYEFLDESRWKEDYS